ncbi:conserved hypothetical protein [Hyphomicrobium sp. GJ21]|uniref:hypothetical protein n=1 Tax=Hyphomicrobium sp. GJ21 TaxID=113574 RepID=UPI000622BEBE|nr:hypothetical protein [Hyphomicrobium sp. GJ21]MBN9291952.1 hypothetical protein [Hyphomicrobium denitrificans]CEJ84337.1 conserved hypothetical protein [Hyphomicrobium sp. GJ21]
MKLHQKGFLLVELSRSASLWDEELIARTLREYGLSGEYWENSVRIALDELAAGGLVARLQSDLKTIRGKPMLTFHYALTDFGKTRMRDTGLLTEARTS